VSEPSRRHRAILAPSALARSLLLSTQ